MKIIIIGIGTSGLFSAITIKKRMRDAEIVFFDKKDFDILHSCGIPYVIEGHISSFDELKSELPDMGFVKYHEHEVKKIMPDEKKVIVEDLKTKETSEHTYDRLIIASGSRPFIPKIPGTGLQGVFCIHGLEESFGLSRYMDECKKAVIIGAGAIGLETAVALRKKGLDVCVIEMLDHALPRSLDNDMALILQEHLENLGIRLIFGSRLTEIQGEDKVRKIVLDTEEIETDLVVLAIGVKGNHGFVEDSGIALGRYGIITDEKMQTSHPDIYATGDCTQVKSRIDQRDISMQLAVAAYKQGVVAGKNIAGTDATYKGALGTFASKIGDLEVAATGFNTATADTETFSGKARSLTRPDWCHGATEITSKIISDKEGNILGAQAIGSEGAASRINMISTAISSGINVYDLSDIEMTYCPEISETYDVLMQAADNLIRKIKSRGPR